MNNPPELASKIVTLMNVADAETNIAWSAPIPKFADQPRRRLPQHIRHLWGNTDKGVGKIFGVVLPRPDVPAFEGPLAGINAQPPTAATTSGKLKNMAKRRTIAPAPPKSPRLQQTTE